MKIEYLESGSSDCPLIRIYGTNAVEFSQLYEAARILADNLTDSIAIEKLSDFQSLDSCSLIFRVGSHNEGVAKQIGEQDHTFEFTLAPTSWEWIADLIKPFTKPQPNSRHQWLCGKEARGGLSKSKIAIVISSDKDGAW